MKYIVLVPFILTAQIIRGIYQNYPYAPTEKIRKELKSVKHNILNQVDLLKSVGSELYCKLALGTAREGVDFITVTLKEQEEHKCIS